VESYLEQILSHGFFHADPVRTVLVLKIVELSHDLSCLDKGEEIGWKY